MNIPALITALAVIIISGASAAEKETNQAARLAGTWTCLSATVNGKPLSESAVKKLRLTMTQPRYKTERTDEVLFDSTYRLDAAKTPMHINMVGTEGDLISLRKIQTTEPATRLCIWLSIEFIQVRPPFRVLQR